MDLVTIDNLLTTTRSVRKRLDMDRPVEPEIIERCIEIAMQAPTGSNSQGWSFVVVTDADKKARIGEWYSKTFFDYLKASGAAAPRQDAVSGQMKKVVDSSVHLAQNIHKIPVMVIPCIEGRVETRSVMEQAGLYGSILPAAWSFMLALRARGLGTAWTTLHLAHEKEVGELLGIPPTVTQSCLLPVAYYTGTDFKPAVRLAQTERTFWNTWGAKR